MSTPSVRKLSEGQLSTPSVRTLSKGRLSTPSGRTLSKGQLSTLSVRTLGKGEHAVRDDAVWVTILFFGNMAEALEWGCLACG